MGIDVRLPVLVLRQGVEAPLPDIDLSFSDSVKLYGSRTGKPRWISGTIASLAISGAAKLIFDLGPDWHQYGLLAIAVKGNNAITSITCSASDDAGVSNASPLHSATGAGAVSLALAAAGDALALALPSGQYIVIDVVNGGTAQAATSNVRITAYPS